MVNIKAKVLIKTNQAGYGIKLAAQLKKMGLTAVCSSDSEPRPDENFKVILTDHEDGFIPVTKHNTQIMVLTNDSDPGSYVVHKDGVLFISKALEIYSICSIVEFHVSGKSHEINVEQTATMLIRRMGIPLKVKGYIYLRTAVMCVCNEPELIYTVNNILYDKISEIHGVDGCKVERAIRDAINIAYNKTPDMFLEFFPYTAYKPSNSEVIALIVDNIRMGMF